MSDADDGDDVAQGELVPPGFPGSDESVSWELQIQQWQYQSPLPPPPVLQEYEKLIPGFAERFMTAWEGQGSHRQGLERTVVAAQTTTQLRGQRYTLALGVSALVVAGVLGVTGHEASALGVVGMDFLSLGGVFIFARRSALEELREKAKQVPETLPPPAPQRQVKTGAPIKKKNRGRRR